MVQMLFRTVSFRAEDRNGMMRAVHGDSEEEEKSPVPIASCTIWV